MSSCRKRSFPWSFIWHAVLFVSAFSIEVRVNAAETVRLPQITEQKMTQQPRNCLSKIGESCALATFDHQKFLLILDDAEIWMDENTSIVRVSTHDLSGKEKHEVRLLKGQIWVSAQTPFRVSGDYGAVLAKSSAEKLIEPEQSGRSDFWVRIDADQMVISSVTEPVLLWPRNSGEHLLLPAGLENRLGKSDESGAGTSGVPMPIAFGAHLARWARLFSGPRKNFEGAIERFHERWLVATRLSADINLAQVERRMETLKENSEKEKAQLESSGGIVTSSRTSNGDAGIEGTGSTADSGSRKSASIATVSLTKRNLTPEERRRLVNQRVNDLFRKKFFSGE